MKVDTGIVSLITEPMRIESVGRSHPATVVRCASRAKGRRHGRDTGFTRTSQRHAD